MLAQIEWNNQLCRWRIYKTKKQAKQAFTKNMFDALLKHIYLTNRKGIKFCFSFPIGQNKAVYQRNKSILGENLVGSLFLNPSQGKKQLVFVSVI